MSTNRHEHLRKTSRRAPTRASGSRQPRPPVTASARRPLLLGLAAGLSIAALVAIVALLTHRFDRTDLQLIVTSLGFSVFSALAAAGAPARRRPELRAIGTLTGAAALMSYGALELAIWTEDVVWTWRVFGVLTMLALASSHASLVLSARRHSDSIIVKRLALASVLTAIIDAALAAIAIAGAFQHVTSDELRLAGVLVIAMMLSTALPPILRRAQRPSHAPSAHDSTDSLARELRKIADHLQRVAPTAGELAHDIEREAARIRDIAQSQTPSTTLTR